MIELRNEEWCNANGLLYTPGVLIDNILFPLNLPNKSLCFFIKEYLKRENN